VRVFAIGPWYVKIFPNDFGYFAEKQKNLADVLTDRQFCGMIDAVKMGVVCLSDFERYARQTNGDSNYEK
jgi:hypothetical protein